MHKENNTQDVVYDFVCRNSGKCTYYISKKLKMSGGKVRYALSRLQQSGLVKFKFVRQSQRILKLTYPIEAFHLLPKGLMKELKKIKI